MSQAKQLHVWVSTCVHLNGQLAGEVAACKAGQVSTEEEEKKAERHGLLHFTIPIGLIDLPIDGQMDGRMDR